MAEELNTEQDLVTSYRRNLEYNAKDEDLLVAINKAMSESKELKEKIDKEGEINKRYWRYGTTRDLTKLHPSKSKIIINRIFTDVETAIPILTANTPEATVMGNFDNDVREQVQEALKIAFEVKYKMQQRLQSLIRHWFLFKVGIFKYRWDMDRGFITENVIAKKVGMDKRATEKENCEYIWEELEDSVENLVEKFPKKKKDLIDITGKDSTKSKVKYIEFWGGSGEWVCWAIPAKGLILEKKKNPNFDYENEENNLFRKPEFPYLFLNVLNVQDNTSLYDETSLIEECIPAQEGANQLEQQILDLNEGQKRVWVAMAEAMSERKAQELVNKTGDLVVYLDRKAPQGGLQQVQSGKPDASLFNNLTHLLSEIDNITGVHSTTRGERAQQETATGRQLLMSSDIGRMDMIVRNVEQVVEDWYNAYLHMLKVYSIGPEVLMNGEQKIELTADMIPTDLLIMIKKGSTLPTDDITRMQMAQGLAQVSMIDPKTLFEEMGYGNIDQRVQDLYQWLQVTGRIQPQMPQGVGQPPQGVGQETGGVGQQMSQQGGNPQEQQLARLQGILQSEQFNSLPPEQQKEVVGQARQIVEQIKQQ
jgi:hypothetical protein